MSRSVEAVEKVSKQILGRDAEKSDLTESATINDLMIGKGQETPENSVLIRQKDFSYRLVRCSIIGKSVSRYANGNKEQRLPYLAGKIAARSIRHTS